MSVWWPGEFYLAVLGLAAWQVLVSLSSSAGRQQGVPAVRLITASLSVAAAFVGAVRAEELKSGRLGTSSVFNKHISHHLGTEEGLPANWGNDDIRSRDHFVGIATETGLVGCDGDEFSLLAVASTQQLPRSKVLIRHEDGDGASWSGLDGTGGVLLRSGRRTGLSSVPVRRNALEMGRLTAPRGSTEYSFLAFGDRDLGQFSHRLNGHDERWVDEVGNRFVRYMDVRPGDDRFHSKALQGNSVWAETAVQGSIRGDRRWWEWTWLRVSISISVIAGMVACAFHRLRVARRVNEELRHEVADRILAQEECRQHQEQLNRVSRAASMGELSASIAHEIKQPLFAIVSNAQTAGRLLDREQPDVDEIREALADIASDGKRASDIIDRVLAMVKKERNSFRELDLNEVVCGAVSFAKMEMVRRKLQLKLELAEELPPVSGDPIELQQVILNLLINAAQAMEESGVRELIVRTRAVNSSVQVAVEDHGTGIDEEQSHRIFDPFFTTREGGIGMGLAINRRIIAAHRGRIWTERNKDQGMTFFFEIPAKGRKVDARLAHDRSFKTPFSGDRANVH